MGSQVNPTLLHKLASGGFGLFSTVVTLNIREAFCLHSLKEVEEV